MAGMIEQKAIWLLAGVAVVLVALGFGTAVVVINRPTPSAAESIITFLLAVILALALAGGGAVLAGGWWKRRKKRAKLEDAVLQAQVYALLTGARLPRAPAGPGLPQGGGSSIFVGGQYPTTPGLTVENLARAVEATQRRGDPLAGLLPPDRGGWEVVE